MEQKIIEKKITKKVDFPVFPHSFNLTKTVPSLSRQPTDIREQYLRNKSKAINLKFPFTSGNSVSKRNSKRKVFLHNQGM